MKITKYVHSCLLVEMPADTNRTALFDPGVMSEEALDVSKLEYLDDIIITHSHADHLSMKLMKQLLARFPTVHITAPTDAVEQLKTEGISASSDPTSGLTFFNAPHEDTEPMFPIPEQIGVHYLNSLTNPGDSHSFHETKQILALPVTAPWGTTIKAVQLALELRPTYILPIHDWHWSEAARAQMYSGMEQLFSQNGIQFFKLESGQPVVIDI